jgi:hypothetical protein
MTLVPVGSKKVSPAGFKITFAYLKMVFCYQNCSSYREKLLKFDAEGQEFAKI